MESLTLSNIIKTVKSSGLLAFTLNDFGRLFDVSNRQNLYKSISRLEQKGIIKKIVKGKYLFALEPVNDYFLANFIYAPSYVSLESALSFYGVITGFPYDITSITPRKTNSLHFANKEFRYTKIALKFFWGYEKKDNFLIAEKEKALLDYIYLGSKGLRNWEFDEMDLSGIDRKKLAVYAQRFNIKKLPI